LGVVDIFAIVLLEESGSTLGCMYCELMERLWYVARCGG
jgi:hypothetical protein